MILVSEFDKYQDVHSSAWFLFISTSRAFSYWLDLMCCAYVAIVTFSFLVLETSKKFLVVIVFCVKFFFYYLTVQVSYGGEVGLAITQCIGLTGLFQWGMRQSAELENQMTSVERVLEFTKVEHEPSLESVSWMCFNSLLLIIRLRGLTSELLCNLFLINAFYVWKLFRTNCKTLSVMYFI